MTLGLAVVLAGPGWTAAPPEETAPEPTPTPCPYELAGGEKRPVFTNFMRPDDPRDLVIMEYWSRAGQCEATPTELVDLGTLLFERGFPRDAIRAFGAATDLDGGMFEAWFRAGLVHQSLGELGKAKKAYKKCLKLFKGHGPCNFYMGLAEEQSGDPSSALHYYRKAFKYAPSLADPKVNPAVLQSRLELGAFIRATADRDFKDSMPMELLNPDRLQEAADSLQPTPTPTPEPTRSTGWTSNPSLATGVRKPARSGTSGTWSPTPTPAAPPVSPGVPTTDTQRHFPAGTDIVSASLRSLAASGSRPVRCRE